MTSDDRHNYLLKENANVIFNAIVFHYTNFFLQDPLPLEQCVICCEQDWDDCFEIQEFINKETFVFKVSGMIYISTYIPINE